MTTYTPAQLARHLQVSRNKVMGWIHGGQLIAANLASGQTPRYRITQDALESFLDSRRVKPATHKQASRRITQRTTRDYFA